jgi:hypothetical protein
MQVLGCRLVLHVVLTRVVFVKKNNKLVNLRNYHMLSKIIDVNKCKRKYYELVYCDSL